MPLVRSPHSVYSSGLYLMASLPYERTTCDALGLMFHQTVLMDRNEKDQSRGTYMPKQTLRIQDRRRCTEYYVTARYSGRNALQRARKQGTLLKLASSRGVHSSNRNRRVCIARFS